MQLECRASTGFRHDFAFRPARNIVHPTQTASARCKACMHVASLKAPNYTLLQPTDRSDRTTCCAFSKAALCSPSKLFRYVVHTKVKDRCNRRKMQIGGTTTTVKEACSCCNTVNNTTHVGPFIHVHASFWKFSRVLVLGFEPEFNNPAQGPPLPVPLKSRHIFKGSFFNLGWGPFRRNENPFFVLQVGPCTVERPT